MKPGFFFCPLEICLCLARPEVDSSDYSLVLFESDMASQRGAKRRDI